jgi:anti-sigma-K factor RskA
MLRLPGLRDQSLQGEVVELHPLQRELLPRVVDVDTHNATLRIEVYYDARSDFHRVRACLLAQLDLETVRLWVVEQSH